MTPGNHEPDGSDERLDALELLVLLVILVVSIAVVVWHVVTR